jgi:hypothetical protein
MQSAVKLKGTANDSKIDTGMTVEILIPWKALNTHMTKQVGLPPKNNDKHRINFYRIDRRNNVSNPDLFAWSPTLNGSFHTPAMFGNIVYTTSAITPVMPRMQDRSAPDQRLFLSASTLSGPGSGLRVSYRIANPEAVVVSIYSISGRKIRTIVDEVRPAGQDERIWDGTDAENAAMASGIYLVSMQAGNFRQTCMAQIRQ